MNREDIIHMAREAFLPYDYETRLPLYIPQLGRFAALVAAAEREACAKLCDENDYAYETWSAAECAAAIRARSN